MRTPSPGWNVTVTGLMKVFQGALLAIIPWAERARIPWKDDSCYDDWEEICDVLFRRIVSATLHSGNVPSAPLVKYGVCVEDYSNFSLVGVHHKGLKENPAALVSLASSSSPLDTVKAQIFEPASLKVVGQTVIAFREAEFVWLTNQDGNLTEVIRIYPDI